MPKPPRKHPSLYSSRFFLPPAIAVERYFRGRRYPLERIHSLASVDLLRWCPTVQFSPFLAKDSLYTKEAISAHWCEPCSIFPTTLSSVTRPRVSSRRPLFSRECILEFCDHAIQRYSRDFGDLPKKAYFLRISK